MVFYSCEKENIEEDPKHKNTDSNIHLAKERSLSDSEAFAVFPERELYVSILTKLYGDSLFQDNYPDLTQNFGYPMINLGTINVTSPSEYALTIPLVKDGNITSFIFYFANSDYFQFVFSPISAGFELLNQPVSSNLDPVALITLIKFNNYQSVRYSRYYPLINNWLIELSNFNNLDASSERTITQHTIYYNTRDVIDEALWLGYHSTTFFIACEDSGGAGTWGGWFSEDNLPTLGGSGDTDPPGDDPIDKVGTIDPTEINPDCVTYFFNEEALKTLQEFAESTIYSCESDLTTEEIIENILAKLCEGFEGIPTLAGGSFEISHIEWPDLTITAEDIRNAFLEEDAIIYWGLELSGCPRLHCLIQALEDQEDSTLNSPLMCQLLKPFLGTSSSDPNLYISALDFSTVDGWPNNAEANFFSSDEQNRIVFNTLNCQNFSTFWMYSTLMHELIHVNIRLKLQQDYGLSLSNVSTESFQEAFKMLLEEMGYNGSNWNNEHQLMLNHYLNDMVESLWLANGEKGEKEIYLKYILDQFGSTEDILFEFAINNWPDMEFESIDDVKSFIKPGIDYFSDNKNIDDKFTLCEPE
ncbi:MAG: hypothetical protein EA362_12905 [Saprospirales bacterium]|nr:MAG: hypothetical protein EA362_12905 [Saprospirales bacterium]